MEIRKVATPMGSAGPLPNEPFLPKIGRLVGSPGPAGPPSHDAIPIMFSRVFIPVGLAESPLNGVIPIEITEFVVPAESESPSNGAPSDEI